MTKHWIIALGILSLEAQAEADFETLGACSGLYEAGGNMARWRAVQGIAEALGRQQQCVAIRKRQAPRSSPPPW